MPSHKETGAGGTRFQHTAWSGFGGKLQTFMGESFMFVKLATNSKHFSKCARQPNYVFGLVVTCRLRACNLRKYLLSFWDAVKHDCRGEVVSSCCFAWRAESINQVGDSALCYLEFGRSIDLVTQYFIRSASTNLICDSSPTPRECSR